MIVPVSGSAESSTGYKFPNILQCTLSSCHVYCVQSGERRPDIIFNGFDYDRWKKILKKVNVYSVSSLIPEWNY